MITNTDYFLAQIQRLERTQIKRLITLATKKLFIASGELYKQEYRGEIMLFFQESEGKITNFPICVPIFANDCEDAKKELAKIYKDEEGCHLYSFENISFEESNF